MSSFLCSWLPWWGESHAVRSQWPLLCRPHANGHAGLMPPPVQYAMFAVGPDGRPLGPPVAVPPGASGVAPGAYGGPPVPQALPQAMPFARPPLPGGPPQQMAMHGWHAPRPPMHAPPLSQASQLPPQAYVSYVAPGYAVPAGPGIVEPSFGAKLQAALGQPLHQPAGVVPHAAIHHSPTGPAWVGSPVAPANMPVMGADVGQGRGSRGKGRSQRGRGGRVSRNSG